MDDDAIAQKPDAPAPLGLLASLAFWVSLFAAAGLFAAATLSGQFLEAGRREDSLDAETHRVEELALEIHRLELEIRALETDSDYIAAVARRTLSRDDAGTSSQAATPASAPASPAMFPATDRSIVGIWMQRIAGDGLLRSRLLMGAAALVLFGFTFLHERSRSASG
jgi:hypothetical protein